MRNLKINVPEGFEIDKDKSTFEEIIFKPVLLDITERVKTPEDALKVLGEKDEDVVQYRLLEEVGASDYIKSSFLAVCVAKALNEGWRPDYSDHKQIKYYAYFIFDKNGVPSYFYFDNWNYYCCTSARFALKSSKLAKYFGEQFIELHKKYIG